MGLIISKLNLHFEKRIRYNKHIEHQSVIILPHCQNLNKSGMSKMI